MRVVQEKVKLDSHLALVVVDSGQVLCWSAEADNFRSAIDWTGKGDDAEPRTIASDCRHRGCRRGSAARLRRASRQGCSNRDHR